MNEDKRIANNALLMLQEVPLKGSDMPAFVEVFNWLTHKATGAPIPPQGYEVTPDPAFDFKPPEAAASPEPEVVDEIPL